MEKSDHEWADTKAAKMLLAGLQNAKAEFGLSVRKAGKELGFKQATFISRMSSGKSPIPIERAEEIAALLMMDPAAFLQAVVEQRYPDVDWRLINSTENERQDALARELEAIIGAQPAVLNEHQRRVMREVASEPQPHLRWLSVNDAATARALANKPSRQEDSATSQDDIDEILAQLSRDED